MVNEECAGSEAVKNGHPVVEVWECQQDFEGEDQWQLREQEVVEEGEV
jgi:hypothetical protein